MTAPEPAQPDDTNLVSSLKTSTHQGFVSSLSVSQSEALERLSTRCREGGLLSWPAGLKANESLVGISDELALLRVLRARKFDVEGAYNQFKEALQLRNVNDIVSVYNSIDVADYDETKKLYPHWTGRRDKQGNPICFFDIGHLKVSDLAKYNTTQTSKGSQAAPPQTIRALTVHDELTRFVLPFCSAIPSRPNPDAPLTSCLYLVDISALSMKWAWNARKWVQDISKLLATSYPELLDKVLVIGAPSFFPKVWPWIKPWIDPVTAEKIQILSPTEVLPTMKELMHPQDIPTRYGGEFECVHGMQPDLDSEARSTLNWSYGIKEGFPIGPLKWAIDETARWNVVSCGKENGQFRENSLATLRPEAKTSLI